MDIADFWRGALSLRRLYVLLTNLPPESRVWAITRGVPYGWTPQVSMTADVFHALTGEAHPAAPKPKKARTGIADRLRKQRERLAAQSASTT